MITEHDPVLADLARYQSRIDADEEFGALADAVEERADELLEDPQFIYDFLGDVDHGGGLEEQAVKAIVRAIRAELNRNPALAYRYRQLALKEAESEFGRER